MPLNDDQCLTLYEQGAARHAIDRALLLVSTTGDNAGGAADWADQPLGLRDARLLALRRAWFGPHFDAVQACPACQTLMSVSLDLRTIEAPVSTHVPEVLQVAGQRFRRPTTRDLAAISASHDLQEARSRLLNRLAIDAPPEGGWTVDQVDAVEAAMDHADPLAHLTIAMQCAHCGHPWQAPLDIAAVLWDELAAQAQAVVQDVHLLASAFGWSERDILAMPPARRQLYLAQVTA
jgi:hypothetical protein